MIWNDPHGPQPSVDTRVVCDPYVGVNKSLEHGYKPNLYLTYHYLMIRVKNKENLTQT